MRARIYNKSKRVYYISEIYGIVNCGVDKYLVDDVEDRNLVVLVEAVDFSTPYPHGIYVERIDNNPLEPLKWVYVEKEEMKYINGAIASPGKYHYFRGYQFIWEQKEALTELIKKGTIDKAKLHLGNISTKLPDWNYIEKQEDIDNLMKQFAGFHDSVLKEFSYLTGDYVSQDGTMYLTEDKQIKLVFNSDLAKELEMVLLAPRFVQLVPPCESYFANLYDASLFIKDCMVYFYDSYLQEISDSYKGTYMTSMGVMWRCVEL